MPGRPHALQPVIDHHQTDRSNVTEFYPRTEWAVRRPIFRKISTPTPEGWQHHTGIRLQGAVPMDPGRLAVIKWARNFEEAELKHDPNLIAIGYHRLIISSGPHDGAVVETRPWGTQGGATFTRNSVSHAICITGNFSAGDIPSEKALDSAAGEWADSIRRGFVSLNAFIDSHSRAPDNHTACCGLNLISQLPSMRDRVKKKLLIPPATPVPPAKPSTNPVPPTIRLGSRGPVVSLWQSMLNTKAGTHLAIDGIFGNATHTATMKFQEFFHLTPVDGIVGPITWGMMEYIIQNH